MAKQINNEPCLCGSGVKQKICCPGKMPHTPWAVFPEELAVGELLKISKKFRSFYFSERGKVTDPIFWAQDFSLPPGVDFSCTKLNTRELIIRFRKIPARSEDAIKVAHELQHLILSAEGFPGVAFKDSRFEHISSSMGSMVLDPLVNARLKTHGFNLRKDYEAELKETASQLANFPQPPTNRFDKILWTFNYTANLLDWETASQKINQGNDEFHKWFDKQYPKIARKAWDLFFKIKETGYDTPEKLVKVFSEIIREYKLEKSVFIVNS